MKNIITAINNPELNNEIKKEKNLKIIYKDIIYKEGIIEILEEKKEINLIIINYDLPGKIEIEDLVNKIKKINEKIELIFILEKEDIEKEQKLNTVYVKNMHDWLYVSPVTNEEICWVDTVFKHKKGEYFIVKGNLTTHDYLHDAGFTHDKLHKYTHSQIRNLSSINNLKQNYYDLLVRLRYGSSND